MKQLNVKENTKMWLPAMGSWKESCHLFESDSIWAIEAALAAERPLLIRGEPGTGKSQLARAAAFALKRGFISEVVHAGFECQDLQYRFDAVARLGNAQVIGARAHCDADLNVDRALDPLRFLTPGALWWTFNWNSAQNHVDEKNTNADKPEFSDDYNPVNGSVLLIDEIDKADADLPNGLLETLGNGAFKVPWVPEPVSFSGDNVPLVVITTNEERDLPSAFLRRCMVLNLTLPKKKEGLEIWLKERGRVHYTEKECDDKVLEKAVSLLVDDRFKALEKGLVPPGQAEFLDLLRAVTRIASSSEERLDALDAISRFSLDKHPAGI